MMEIKEKLEIIKHITLGTKEIFYYPYNYGKEPLPLRPISSFELDQCIYNSLENCSNENVISFIIKFKLGIIKGDENIELSPDAYKELLKYYNEIDYWIIYYGMKDFQDISFSTPDFDIGIPNGINKIREMKEIHEIASFILSASTQNEDVIKEIFSDPSGRDIAEIIIYLKIPLTSFSKLTKLQKNYLIYSRGHIDSLTEEQIQDKYIRSGQTMTYKEFLEKFR